MKRTIGSIAIGMSLLGGCSENTGQTNLDTMPKRPVYHGPTTAESEEVVATVNGEPIVMQQLMEPLIEAHGLTMLVVLVEIDLAKQAAAKAHVTVTQEDFDREHDLTLDQLFGGDAEDMKLVRAIKQADEAKNTELAADLRDKLRLEREDYLAQLLDNQHRNRIEFMLGLKINAYVRKVAEPQVAPRITEKAVQDSFAQMFGERIEVEYILLPNLAQVGVAQRRLAEGDSFEQVARDMSTDQATAPQGGRLAPFTRDTAGAPEAFKQTAFTLRDGQVSDVVTLGSSFALIKRLKVDPPSSITFEKAEPVVRQTLHDKLMEFAMKEMKQQLAYEAKTQIDIIHPGLAKQWQEKYDRDTKAAERARKELDKEQVQKDLQRLGGDKNPSTSRTVPAPLGPTAPKADSAPAGERPPATQPGEAPTPPAQFQPNAGPSRSGK